MASWNLQDAKARFSELVNAALTGVPQRVSRRGTEAVVVVRASDYDALTKPADSIVRFFARSPHRDASLDVERAKDGARDAGL